MGLIRTSLMVCLLALAGGCKFQDFVMPVMKGIREGFSEYRNAREAADREAARRADERNNAIISEMRENRKANGVGLEDALLPGTLVALAGGAVAMRKKPNGGAA